MILVMCSSKEEFSYVNRHSRLSLTSYCLKNCSQIINITWNIYQGTIDSSNKMIQWNRFIPLPMSSFFFLGLNTKNLLVMKDVMMTSEYWRFQVIYRFESEISESIFDIELNDGPKDGFCSISPLNGTILALFTINCTDLFDQDGIKDFSVYGINQNFY